MLSRMFNAHCTPIPTKSIRPLAYELQTSISQTECCTLYETATFTVLIIVLIEVVRMVYTWYDMGTVYVPIVEGEVAVALDRNGTLASAAQLLSIEDVAAVISDVAEGAVAGASPSAHANNKLRRTHPWEKFGVAVVDPSVVMVVQPDGYTYATLTQAQRYFCGLRHRCGTICNPVPDWPQAYACYKDGYIDLNPWWEDDRDEVEAAVKFPLCFYKYVRGPTKIEPHDLTFGEPIDKDFPIPLFDKQDYDGFVDGYQFWRYYELRWMDEGIDPPWAMSFEEPGDTVMDAEVVEQPQEAKERVRVMKLNEDEVDEAFAFIFAQEAASSSNSTSRGF